MQNMMLSRTAAILLRWITKTEIYFLWILSIRLIPTLWIILITYEVRSYNLTRRKGWVKGRKYLSTSTEGGSFDYNARDICLAFKVSFFTLGPFTFLARSGIWGLPTHPQMRLFLIQPDWVGNNLIVKTWDKEKFM